MYHCILFCTGFPYFNTDTDTDIDTDTDADERV